MIVVVAGAFRHLAAEGLVPALWPDIHRVGRHDVCSAGHQARHALGHDERLAGEVLGNILEAIVVVVVTDYIKGVGAEQMVARIRLVTACRYIARGVERTGQVGQFLGQHRIDRHAGIGVCQHILAVAEVQYQVGFLQAEGVGVGAAPLLQHLVADAPLYHGGMVAVALHLVGQVALVPFVEVVGIVVLSLAAAPHVEELVLHQQSHAVAQRQQLGRRRIVRCSDGVHTHLLHDLQLTLDGAAVHHGSERTRIMVQAYAVYLHGRVVEEESFGGVIAQIAESGGGLHAVQHLPFLLNLRVNRVQVGTVHTPQFRIVECQSLLAVARLPFLQYKRRPVPGHDTAVRSYQHGYYTQHCRFLARVGHGGGQFHLGALLRYVERNHVLAP